MNREDKETLYTFLDAANRMLSEGVLSPSSMPDFSDDPQMADGARKAALMPDRAEGSIPGESIGSIASRIAGCTRCGLCATRQNTVPGVGPDNPLVMVVGEAPGANEDAQGEPFVGKAGELLDKMLAAIGLSRETNCFIANIVKCRPPENRDPSPEEAAACAPFLEAQIAALKPRAIIAVGRIAAQYLLNTQTGIGQLRGRFFDYRGIPLMPTYHPSALLRDENLKRPAWEDLKGFKAEILSGGAD